MNRHDSVSTDFPLLLYLRFLFYLYFAYKIIHILFLMPNQINTQQKLERRIMNSHAPLILEGLSQEDKELLQLTIKNTLQNATQPLRESVKKTPPYESKKRVKFMTESNVYYDPCRIR